MTPLGNAVRNIIYDKHDFCSLCFAIVAEECLQVQDELTLEGEQTETLDNILTSVLGSEVTENFSQLDRICNACLKSALSLHSFKEKCTENSQKLFNAMESLYKCLENISENVNSFRSLFLSINLCDLTSNQYYDHRECMPTLPMVMKHFKSLKNSKIRRKKWRNNSTNEHNYKRKRSKETLSNIKEEISDTEFSDKDSESYSFICSQCGKIFHEKSNLKAHELSHSLKIPCTKCNKVYKSKHAFRDHMCRPDRERPLLEKNYVCDNCGAKFVRKPTLQLHMKFEHGDGIPHICMWCSKKFYSPSNLQLHELKHTKEKNYKCDECGGHYVTKASLMYHQRIHTGEKPFKCKHCNMRFLSASRRSDHTRRHHMEPSLNCGICPKIFKGYSTLLRHRKLHRDPNSSLYINETDRSNVLKIP